MPSRTNWAAIDGVVEARQEERAVAAHPGVADHQVLDRGPLGVPEVERAGDVRRRLDDRERRQVRIGGGTRPVGGEHVRGEPALVDRALDIVRRIGLRQVRHRSVLAKQKAPLVQRTNGSWYHLLVRRPVRAAHRGPDWFRRPRDALSGVSRHGSRATFTSSCPRGSHHPALAPGPFPSLLFPVIAVRAGV